ncbi:MAG: hypothetical protein AB1553_01845 [Nitrospirota bacterium]
MSSLAHLKPATKALFIPLKKEHFDAFERGDKTFEFRQFGKRWNERTCKVGRPVVLSCGYGKARRLSGTIKSFAKSPVWKSKGYAEYLLCYGGLAIGPVAEIEIEVKRR